MCSRIGVIWLFFRTFRHHAFEHLDAEIAKNRTRPSTVLVVTGSLPPTAGQEHKPVLGFVVFYNFQLDSLLRRGFGIAFTCLHLQGDTVRLVTVCLRH